MPGIVMNFFTLFYRNPRALILAIVGILLAGVVSILTLPRMEDPRLKNRVAILLTPWPGAAADRVEALVTDPIEDKLRELSDFELMESVSRTGLSYILVELKGSIDDTEKYWSMFDCNGREESALLRLNCPVTPGNSGGPVLARQDENWAVAGVISAMGLSGALAVPVSRLQSP